MANNAGFSAAESYFGTITGLTPKESSDGKTGSVAEAHSAIGDTIAHDEYAQLMAPSTTYAVTADVSTSNIPALGSIVGSTNKIMVTQVAITTTAGQPPTVTISGQEVHSGATAKRTYALPSGSILARCKAQDVLGAFTAPAQSATWDFNSVTTTFSVDFVKQSVGGNIVAACATNGKIEVAANVTDAGGSATLTATSGWTITAPAAGSAPDEGYISVTATATKWVTGTDVAPGNTTVGSDD